MIRVSMNAKQTKEVMNYLSRHKMPYIIGKTCGLLALQGKSKVREVTRDKYNLSNEFIPKGIWSVPRGNKFGYLKHEVRNSGKCKAMVYTGDRITWFMPKHEVGVTLTAKDKFIAIPMTKKGKHGKLAKPMKSGSYKSRSGKVKRKYQPANLLNNNSKRKPFIISRNNIGFIVRRKSKKRYPLEYFYLLKPKREVDETWQMQTTVENLVERKYKDVFDKTFIKELREYR